MNPVLEQLKDNVNKLKQLLDDPQPGLYMWNSFVAERIENIYKLWYGEKGK